MIVKKAFYLICHFFQKFAVTLYNNISYQLLQIMGITNRDEENKRNHSSRLPKFIKGAMRQSSRS